MSEIPSDTSSLAERIRALGARVTPARIAVLRELQLAERALSHHDVEHALAAEGFDRVTLYRVLDWLVEMGLAHKNIDADRVSRFSLASVQTQAHRDHAHFRCEGCGKVFCLEDIPIQPPPLPLGFSGKTVDFCITGQCARCDDSHKDKK
ncbi:Fur family transcriptional regulator [Uliginosibacterium gangwonense]|uniref:Fur family transcriptional regulator n=1 Tax=Uliginosibacterium gangwonense TaxID=392736 RepID=UPI00037CBF66|nr:transcriptional repressor [Uliginosibacterium gangwonense]